MKVVGEYAVIFALQSCPSTSCWCEYLSPTTAMLRLLETFLVKFCFDDGCCNCHFSFDNQFLCPCLFENIMRTRVEYFSGTEMCIDEYHLIAKLMILFEA